MDHGSICRNIHFVGLSAKVFFAPIFPGGIGFTSPDWENDMLLETKVANLQFS